MHRFYITTPIYYVNDKPHIGHLYTNVIADTIARFKRLDGFKVFFSTGTDEHGQKVAIAAKNKNLHSQDFVNTMSQYFRNFNHDFYITSDTFVRTSEATHKDYVRGLWLSLLKGNHVYQGKYSGWYSFKDESFFQESEVINKKAISTGNSVKWIEEDCFFFKLSQWQQPLLEYYKSHPFFIRPLNRKNEVVSFVKSGLKDLCITRLSSRWGIRVPGNTGHVFYVWFEALLSYLSALDKKVDFWPVDIHVVGKDILRFHAIYWPAILMSLGLKLPKTIISHGWLLQNGKKISKSSGKTIDPYAFTNICSTDYYRFYLIRQVPLDRDIHFSVLDLKLRVNSELVNKLGNLLHRVCSLIFFHCNGFIPCPGSFQYEDTLILSKAYSLVVVVREAVNTQDLRKALDVLIKLVIDANIYIVDNKPWDHHILRRSTVLYSLSEVLRIVFILLQPFIPELAAQALDYLGIQDRSFSFIDKKFAITPGKKVMKPRIIFKKIL